MKFKRLILCFICFLSLLGCTIEQEKKEEEQEMKISFKEHFDQSYIFHYIAPQASYIDVGIYTVKESGREEVFHTRQRLPQKEGELLFKTSSEGIDIVLPLKEEHVSYENKFLAYEVVSEKQKNITLDEEIVILAIGDEKTSLSSFHNPKKINSHYVIVTFW